jgi:hypothetical protein
MRASATTTIICYLTDCPIPAADAKRLTITDGNGRKAEAVQVWAHSDVLAFQAEQGLIEQTDHGFVATV